MATVTNRHLAKISVFFNELMVAQVQRLQTISIKKQLNTDNMYFWTQIFLTPFFEILVLNLWRKSVFLKGLDSSRSQRGVKRDL